MILEKNNESYNNKEVALKEGIEIAPGVIIYDNVIDNSQELIDLSLLDEKKWSDSKVFTSPVDREIKKEVRNTRVFSAAATFSNDIRWFEVSQIIWQYGNMYGMQNDAPFSNMEYLQLLHYSTGEGFYKPHADSGPGAQRIFSALLYLNDVEEGGETYFEKFDVKIKPKAGRLALFPSNYVYGHEARPPKSNDKFVIVTWFNPVF